MKYFIDETWSQDEFNRTAGNKARWDLCRFLSNNDYHTLNVPIDKTMERNASFWEKLRIHLAIAESWSHALSNLNTGDLLLIQIPLISHTVLFGRLIKQCQKRGVRIILFIHDLELLRHSKQTNRYRTSFRIHIEESTPLRLCDAIIAHNPSMKDYICNTLGISAAKVFNLNLFDYYSPVDRDNSTFQRESPFVITGSLSKHKAGYVYDLPRGTQFNLYGVAYNGMESDDIRYYGSFDSAELSKVVKGSFGIVWDGPTTVSCRGAYGEYLRFNNPHKASFYLSIGMPIIIWEEAALADFIIQNDVGLALPNLDNLTEVASKMSDSRYNELKRNAFSLGKQVRSGHFTKHVINEVEDYLIERKSS